MQTAEQSSVNGAARAVADLAAEVDKVRAELAAVRREVSDLRIRCSDLHNTLLYFVCPTEWDTEEVDDDALRAQIAEQPPTREWIESLFQR